MEIRQLQIFSIDIQTQSVTVVNKKQYGADLDSYVKNLVSAIAKGDNGRKFAFERDTTEIRASIPRIIAGEDFTLIAKTAADRLLTAEIEAQKKIDKLKKEIQKGIMVQALVDDSSTLKYIMCKADHNEFLKEGDFLLTKGLPLKNKVFKAFIVTYDLSNVVEDIIVCDTSQPMSKYWWKDFLELVEVYTDRHNTITAFESIDKGVFTKLKKDYPQDYVYLRNSTVRYFRANESFVMQDFLDNGIGDYKPYDTKLNIDDLKVKIKELPKEKKFDESFIILKDEVKAKFLNKISLTPQIELHLKEDIPNIENVITAEEGNDGTKYVKIKSEEGFNYFKQKNKNS